MKKTIRRIAIRFTFQFVFFCIISAVVMAILIVAIGHYLEKEEIKHHFSPAALETIMYEAAMVEDGIQLRSFWEEQLSERNMWLQVLDQDGRVIGSFNDPAELPNSYALNELLAIQNTHQYGPYRVYTSIDNTLNDYNLYMLGFIDDSETLLQNWARMAERESFSPEQMQSIQQEVERMDTSLAIFDADGRLIESFGNQQIEKAYSPVEITEQQFGPELSVYRDPETDYVWVLQETEATLGEGYNLFSRRVLIVVAVFGGIIFILGVLFTAWHAYRYGQPLLLFIQWLEKLGQGQYSEFLSEKGQKKIMNRNKRVKSRYKLYEAVIHAFYEMAGKLKKADEEQKQLEQTREEWMTGISHDLRTPLASVQGYGHLLESGSYDWSKQELQEIGATIREKGDYMLELVQDFSLAFQLGNDALPLTKKRMDLAEVVHHAVLHKANDVTMKEYFFSFHHSLDKPLYMAIDRKWFERMLDNLLSNAVKHNPAQTKIDIEVHQVEGGAEVVIRDNGVGMDEMTKQNLFERYYRGTNTEEASEGSGLGLNIAKGIAEAHSGTISVDSELGKGTTLYLRFRF